MMSAPVLGHDPLHVELSLLRAIDLDALNDKAALQTRKDRKYVISAEELTPLLAELPESARILEIDGRRRFGYRSVYFDTPEFDSYRLAACRRPARFKVRTRTYLDSGACFAEVKRKNRRCQTVKERVDLSHATDVRSTVRAFADTFKTVESFSHRLAPVLTSTYQRATLVLPEQGVRFTIDAGYECIGQDGRLVGLDQLILETKTEGVPSIVDRALWAAGHRPVKISKYATGLAAMHPELPANRWAPVLRAHFDRNHVNSTPTCLQGGTS